MNQTLVQLGKQITTTEIHSCHFLRCFCTFRASILQQNTFRTYHLAALHTMVTLMCKSPHETLALVTPCGFCQRHYFVIMLLFPLFSKCLSHSFCSLLLLITGILFLDPH